MWTINSQAKPCPVNISAEMFSLIGQTCYVTWVMDQELSLARQAMGRTGAYHITGSRHTTVSRHTTGSYHMTVPRHITVSRHITVVVQQLGLNGKREEIYNLAHSDFELIILASSSSSFLFELTQLVRRSPRERYALCCVCSNLLHLRLSVGTRVQRTGAVIHDVIWNNHCAANSFKLVRPANRTTNIVLKASGKLRDLPFCFDLFLYLLSISTL